MCQLLNFGQVGISQVQEFPEHLTARREVRVLRPEVNQPGTQEPDNIPLACRRRLKTDLSCCHIVFIHSVTPAEEFGIRM